MPLEVIADETLVTIEATDLELSALADQIVIEIEENGVTNTYSAEEIDLSIEATASAPIVSTAEVQVVLIAEQGPPGPSGSGSGQTSTYVYGETLSALVPVVIINGQAFKADSGNVAHRGRVCGITTSSATAGNSGTVRFLGAMSDGAWNWSGPLVFVGPSGTLVQTPPNGFSQAIARVESPDTIFVNPLSLFERN